MKLHVTLLSAAIASAMFASPLWADDSTETTTTTPTTTSAPPTGTRPAGDARPEQQKVREQEKDKDDAKAVPKTKPGAMPSAVQSNKNVFYVGDEIILKVVIPKSLKDVWAGKATANVVITLPGGDLAPIPLKVPVSSTTEGDKPLNLVKVPASDAATLPAGDYQMALVITKVNGDPLKISDWYGGFKGLLGVKRLKISAATTTGDTEDPNKTGNVTGDTDGDGYPDSDPNMPPPPPADGGTTTPPTGGTPTTGQTAFNTTCGTCHSSTQLKGSSATRIQTAISSVGAMSGLKSLSSQQIAEIATYLGG